MGDATHRLAFAWGQPVFTAKSLIQHRRICRHGAVQIDRQVRNRAALFKAREVIHQQLGTAHGKGRNQSNAMAQGCAGDDVSQLLFGVFGWVQAITVGGFNEQVVGLFDELRGEHDRVVETAQVTGKYPGGTVGDDLHGCRPKDVTGRPQVYPDVGEDVLWMVQGNGAKVLEGALGVVLEIKSPF